MNWAPAQHPRTLAQAPSAAAAGLAGTGVRGGGHAGGHAGGLGVGHGDAGSDRALLDATDRALRAPSGKLAMSLNLSRLTDPKPRPYHIRIALALMQDCASRLGGHVFPLRNGDLVLLCGVPGTDLPAAGFALPATLHRLFAVDAPGDALTTTWRLDQAGAAFRDHVAQCLTDPAAMQPPPAEITAPLGLVPLLRWVQAADIGTLLQQRTAIQLGPGRGLKLSGHIRPLFRDIGFNEAALPDPAAPGHRVDPFILRHLAGKLHARILAMITDDIRVSGPLTRPALLQPMPFHLALSPQAVLSPAFARLGALAASRKMELAVEFSAMDIARDPQTAACARTMLAQTGFRMVLGGIDHAALPLLRLDGLAPNLVKLDWSPRLADGPAGQVAQAAASIRAIGPQRVVLCRVDGEAAIVWGHAMGITAFQGAYMDAVQAASRIVTCPAARACSLRLCVNRALAVHPSERAGCGYPGTLDMMPVVGAERPAS